MLLGAKNALDLLEASAINAIQVYCGQEHNVVIPNVPSAQELPQMSALNATFRISTTKMELARTLVPPLLMARPSLAIRNSAINLAKLVNIITASTP